MRVLRFFGEGRCYGIRSIELRQGTSTGPFGQLRPPGRVLLFDQRPSPWRLPLLSEIERERFKLAGAIVAPLGSASTEVHWPGETLRNFMLLDVLMHEIGHHLLQHHKGKRRARIARTHDHEVFAERFARRCRHAFSQANLA